jgi:hypothetical protein
MTKYYTVSYNNNFGETTTTTSSDLSSFPILQTRTAERLLLSADGVSEAGKLVYFNASCVKTFSDTIGKARIQHDLYIYEGGVFVGSISYLHCFENDEMRFIETDFLSNIVQASGKFTGSFGLPVYLSVDNNTGLRNITFQYV